MDLENGKIARFLEGIGSRSKVLFVLFYINIEIN